MAVVHGRAVCVGVHRTLGLNWNASGRVLFLPVRFYICYVCLCVSWHDRVLRATNAGPVIPPWCFTLASDAYMRCLAPPAYVVDDGDDDGNGRPTSDVYSATDVLFWGMGDAGKENPAPYLARVGVCTLGMFLVGVFAVCLVSDWYPPQTE